MSKEKIEQTKKAAMVFFFAVAAFFECVVQVCVTVRKTISQDT